jgi:hypothetical protein
VMLMSKRPPCDGQRDQANDSRERTQRVDQSQGVTSHPARATVDLQFSVDLSAAWHAYRVVTVAAVV